MRRVGEPTGQNRQLKIKAKSEGIAEVQGGGGGSGGVREPTGRKCQSKKMAKSMALRKFDEVGLGGSGSRLAKTTSPKKGLVL